ncbi:helix-turn-helix domain-containing protein [Kineosporia sp. J2-2]|uniref:Helix-turn-helix domain-containing protein n=1 Tax=Kineosporia corallincola TaxID=2835133 RepID=A0ABS5TMI6_9ACTN|nr:helix-turn-helix transcriptional regulator [Kineosporia corallincola]MBT0770814.1 helix-turn-helix domain-containing protein [Kineosporia corallincola]
MAEPAGAIGIALLRRHIGRHFERLRVQAGLTQDQAAERVELSKSTLIRMENGNDGVKFRDVQVRHMLDQYQASSTDREVLMALTAETRLGPRKSWWHDYTETSLPPWFAMYVSLEDSAATIQYYEQELVPGLLQTKSYAERVMQVPPGFVDDREAARRVQARLERQSLLTRPMAPRLEVAICEAVLHRLVGMGPDVAREQLRHLLDVTQRMNVELRVIPWASGMHGGVASGSFILLHFPRDPITDEPLEPPMAYSDSLTGAMYLTKPAEVHSYRLVWSDVMNNSLDPGASRSVITTFLEGLHSDGEHRSRMVQEQPQR